jgi:hypothetical protein
VEDVLSEEYYTGAFFRWLRGKNTFRVLGIAMPVELIYMDLDRHRLSLQE